MADGGDGTAMNIGTGRETLVRQLAELIVGLAGTGVAISHAPARAGEIVRSLAAVARVQAALGWQAEVALADGLARTLG
jgi:UDP-glucose 4-epimerase